MDTDKRKYKRIKIYPLTVTLQSNNFSIDGFVTDLSQRGILLCIHKNVDNIGDFSLKLPIPGTDNGDTFSIQAQQVRLDTISNLQYNEIGCQFVDIYPEQEENIVKLMATLEDDSDSLNIDDISL